jgi:hypothetical protein
MRMPVFILIMGWVMLAHVIGYAAPRLFACPLPWGVRFVDPEGVQRTPEIGEGVPQPALSPADAGRARGHSGPASPKANPPKQPLNSRQRSLPGEGTKLRQPGPNHSGGAARGGLIQDKAANNITAFRAPSVVRRTAPSVNNVRHHSPNPAVVSGSLTSHGANTGTIDGTRMNHKM